MWQNRLKLNSIKKIKKKHILQDMSKLHELPEPEMSSKCWRSSTWSQQHSVSFQLDFPDSGG